MLHDSLGDLSLENAGRLFTAGQADAIVRCCPRLEALHLGFGVLHEVSDSRLAASLAAMLRAMPGLRSLSLAEVWLSAEVVRALGDLPHLASLTLVQVDCSRQGLEALGGRCTQLRSLSITDMPEDVLCDLLRGMASAPCLAKLHLAIHDRTWSDTSFAARVGPTLSVCTGRHFTAQRGAPLQELSIAGNVHADVIARDSAEVEALLDAASGACGTLRSLSLSGIREHDPPFDPRALAVFRRLESLSLGGMVGSDERRIADLVAIVGAAATALHTVRLTQGGVLSNDSPRPSASGCCVRQPSLIAAELARLKPFRVRMAGRHAWAVVAAGIRAAQERRVGRRLGGSRSAALARSPTGRNAPLALARSPTGRSLAESLPHGVLREIAGFLAWDVPLAVMRVWPPSGAV